MTPDRQNMPLPQINRRILGGFQWYIPRYVRKHFHALAINHTQLQSAQFESADTLVVYANHASWWDPLVAMFAAEKFFSKFDFYAPIEAEALKKYRIFGKLGFFPVQLDSLVGAKQFIDVSLRLLEQPGASVWITPEGRFADVRDGSAEFMPGLSHLAYSLQRRATTGSMRTWFVPIAIEYPFWEERLPEALACFGKPILIAREEARRLSKPAWNDLLTDALRSSQKLLATASIARDDSAFEVLLSGSAGTSRVYDVWRSCLARLTGKKLVLEHGQKLRTK